MLAVDPLARATISQVKQHLWFQKDLPPYLKHMPSGDTMERIESIDDGVLAELVQKFNVPKEKAMRALLDNDNEHSFSKDLKVAYHLIYDAKRIYLSKGTTEDDSASAIPPTSPTYEVRQDWRQMNKTKTWYLGIVSTLLPNKIMRHVYQALRAAGFEWKMVGKFQLRCRCIPEECQECKQTKQTKIVIQLYKMKPGHYLLDVKKLGGDAISFFIHCKTLLANISEALVDDQPSSSSAIEIYDL